MFSRSPTLWACLFLGSLLALAGCRRTGDGTLGAACTTDSDCNPGLICPADGLSHVTGFCVAVPTGTAPVGELQWATAAAATSTLKERILAGVDGATNAYDNGSLIGPPDTNFCGFIGKAWTSALPDDGVQELQLTYKNPVNATGIQVVENQNPGAVVKVELVEEGSGTVHTVFEGKDDNLACPGSFYIHLEQPTDYLTREVRVFVDTDKNSEAIEYSTNYNLIDAVALYGNPTAPDAGPPAEDSSADGQGTPDSAATDQGTADQSPTTDGSVGD